MPTYVYHAIRSDGKRVRGTVTADHPDQAADQLKQEGLWIMQLRPYRNRWKEPLVFGTGPRIKQRLFAAFCRQLAQLHQSGMPMVEAVYVLGMQTESKPFRKVLLDVARDMHAGSQFSKAVSRHPTVFGEVFVSMARAGETGGALGEMLQRLATYFEKEHATREKVKSALAYPLLMIIMITVVVIIMMTAVVPRLASQFASMDMLLPWPTRFVLGLSGWMQSWWWTIVILFALLAVVYAAAKRTPTGAYFIDYGKLKLPIFGKLQLKQALARFSRTYSSLFAASVPLMQLIDIVSSVMGNEALAKVVRESREAVLGGRPLAAPYLASSLFPPVLSRMLEVGERSSTLEDMLSKAADLYEMEADQMAERLRTLLEPVMIVILAVIVGMIVLAVMLPSFTMVNQMGF